MTRPAHTRLPTPWALPIPAATRADSNANLGVLNTASWFTVNTALYMPFSVPVTVLLKSASFFTAASAGNFDMGIYDSTCTTQLAEQGTAGVATGLNTWNLAAPLMLEAGKRYYLGLVCSSGSSTLIRWNNQSVQAQRQGGYAQEALASAALPATATPAQSATAYIPIVVLDFYQ